MTSLPGTAIMVDVERPDDPDLRGLRSDEGWLYASTDPLGAGDPGRFHALFGRDSLISSLQLMIVRPEPPRTLLDVGWPYGGEFNYFATADATSWFLVVLASLGDRALCRELEPAWRAAGDWIVRELDRGGGFVRNTHTTVPGSLVQQGWRDSHDPHDPSGGGILHADGRPPAAGLADADTQAVAYAALRALAALDHGTDWGDRARALRSRVSVRFGGEVMALEPDGTPVLGAGSQLGWLLWAGALEPSAASAAAERLCQPDVMTEFGLRTLSTHSPVFDPHAYHRGSIWPFDSWIGWSGLRAHGRKAEAERVRTGVLAAIERLGDAPELYAVTRAGELEPIALSNRRQAWTIGARWALANRWDGRLLGSPGP